MDIINSLLQALGIDSTIWYQLVIFIITFAFLYYVVFSPYMKAIEQREANTHGQEDQAHDVMEKTKALQSQYESRAREINERIKKVYDQVRAETAQEQQKTLEKAREESAQTLEKSRAQIEGQMDLARASLQKEVAILSKSVADKLLGKGALS